jgi:hypothetical protein
MPSYPGSLAVGLLHVPTNATQTERTQARIALALKAVSEGYALIETYETDGNGVKDDAAFRALEELTVVVDAQALVYAGAVDIARINEVADRARLVVVPV